VDSSALVCIGVVESGNLTRLTAEESVQLRSDLVSLSLTKGVALRTACLEE
jgi:hypothetical protein